MGTNSEKNCNFLIIRVIKAVHMGSNLTYAVKCSNNVMVTHTDSQRDRQVDIHWDDWCVNDSFWSLYSLSAFVFSLWLSFNRQRCWRQLRGLVCRRRCRRYFASIWFRLTIWMVFLTLSSAAAAPSTSASASSVAPACLLFHSCRGRSRLSFACCCCCCRCACFVFSTHIYLFS